jgi:predicted ribosome quality control (RQC) complex YloA/Tae2 family protein
MDLRWPDPGQIARLNELRQEFAAKVKTIKEHNKAIRKAPEETKEREEAKRPSSRSWVNSKEKRIMLERGNWFFVVFFFKKRIRNQDAVKLNTSTCTLP